MEKRTRVLVVDTDEQLLISLERLLEDEGMEAFTTCSAHQALDMLRTVGFDFLVMGDHLRDLSCEQLLREIQRRGVPASIREIQRRGVPASILVMKSSGSRVPSSEGYFTSLGAMATVRKRDFGAILQGIKSLPENRTDKHAGAA